MNEPTYVEPLDFKRIVTLRHRVLHIMKDSGWFTLGELKAFCGGSEAGISARLRELRNTFGYTVNRRRRGEGKNGCWEYQIKENING